MDQSNLLIEIIGALKSKTGDEFLAEITMQLHKVIKADYTFIARIDLEKYVSKTLCLVAKDNFADNFEYSLTDTPCADVMDNSTCIYPNGICQLYPDDQLLIDMNIEGYIGAPLHDSKGNVIGLVVALYEQPIEIKELVVSLFELFSGRISAEIERMENQSKLQQLNHNLEETVATRTSDLQKAMNDLVFAQANIVEQEKLASLGGLVAGVAHEINTPLGIAILSSTNIIDLAETLNRKVEDATLTKSDLESSLKDILLSGVSLSHNLRRAADLVSNFKEVAVERNSNDIMETNLTSWLETQVSSLRPLLKSNNIQLNLLPCDQLILFKTFPAKLSQVFVNLAQNAVMHAFINKNDSTGNQLTISYQKVKNKIKITIADNGIGMESKTLKKIFEPFFTTQRNKGGTGLGLSIVHSIVKGTLEGTIKITSKLNEGTNVEIILPLELKP